MKMPRIVLWTIVLATVVPSSVFGGIVYSGSQNVSLALSPMSPMASEIIQLGGMSEDWDDFRVDLWFGMGMILVMPGWRILLRRWLRRTSAGARPFWGQRRALIIGTDDLARGITRQFQANPGSEVKPIGYLSFAEDRVGSILDGVPVLGTVDELESLIRTEGIQEVLFSTAEASYERIIGLIQALSIRSLDFKIIPREHQVGGDEKSLLRLELAGSGRGRRFGEMRRGFLFKK